jgi:uncharacterized protein (DUF433 family)
MSERISDIYGGKDPRDIPVYSIAEAAKYIHLAPATLRSWIRGRPYQRRDGVAYFRPPIQLSDPAINHLSFWNLVEAYVLRALRVEHLVSMRDVRTALNYAQREMEIKYLLRSRNLETAAGELFIRKYGELVNLSQSGQLAMRMLLEDQLRRVEWDPHDLLATRFFPFPRLRDEIIRIMIDPRIAFGRPVIQPGAISTAIIVARIDAGETVDEISTDYDLDRRAIEEALIYERAQAA